MKKSLKIAAVLAAVISTNSYSESVFEEPIRLTAGGELIDTEVGHAAPWVTDWDGDGRQDLLVGQFGGGKLWVYLNTGSKTEPKLTKGSLFQEGRPEGTVPTG